MTIRSNKRMQSDAGKAGAADAGRYGAGSKSPMLAVTEG